MENIDEYIDKNKHYFILMHPLEYLLVPGFGFVWYKSNTTREKWVECVIVEDQYSLDMGYKVELVSIEPGYGHALIYIDDFIQDLDKNIRVVKKEPNMECVEEKWLEPLTDNVNLCHSAYTLKIKPKRK